MGVDQMECFTLTVGLICEQSHICSRVTPGSLTSFTAWSRIVSALCRYYVTVKIIWDINESSAVFTFLFSLTL